MNPVVDDTHDPGSSSWVESANDPATDFPIQNLPLGRFRRPDDGDWSIGMAIGDQVLDLRRTGIINHGEMNRLIRLHGDPQPLPYLDSTANRERGAIDIELEVWLQTDTMRKAGHAGDCIARSNFADASYWTIAQLVAHHTVNGCSLSNGDLFGSGTLSGPKPEQAGSLLELTGGGKSPIVLSNGERRTFIEDGDTVILRGACAREGLRRIGFGECRATVLPAPRLGS